MPQLLLELFSEEIPARMQTQAARDAVIPGDGAAHEAVRNVKDDPRNDALARARAASDRAFADCHEETPP